MRGKWLRASAFLFSASVPAIMLASGAAAQQSVPMIQIIDPITLLATKTEEKAIDTLAAVSTIRQDQIDRRMATRTSDLFMGMPGVWFQERADDPGTSIVIRGLQDFGRVAVNIDGARQNFQRTGHNSNGIFYIDPEMIGGVDVDLRGPVANIYGSGAIGGVASFRTKDVEDVLKPGQRWGILTHGMATDNSGQLLGSAFTAARVNPNVDFVFGGVAARPPSPEGRPGRRCSEQRQRHAVRPRQADGAPGRRPRGQVLRPRLCAPNSSTARRTRRARPPSTTPACSTTSPRWAGNIRSRKTSCSISTARSIGPRP